ncbi:p-loop containing nucleoside triphosphate hydrolase protein [Coniochaeta hoffmannii]|uniref:P-loop containing nucleoside triphosphate hydrolase protein n=1 Tax=Coniochaeta hoffmannii TaxID=91930 RepID=A0AA38RU82_9PEZI|nr:p-loop containing nucleoside triphosphate hydrolase protein [Coniochaeta hoffmannii]
MTTRGRQLPHEKRKGEAALSDFAEYVEKQQELRFPSSHKPPAAAAAASGASASTSAPTTTSRATKPDLLEHHDELDDLLDTLDLSDTSPRRKLRDLLLSTDSADLQGLTDVLAERLREGLGETVFEIGYEESGEGMRLTREEWEVAYKRLGEAAKGARADCQLLLTKGVGGEVEGTTTAGGKAEGCSGKVLVRQTPRTAEDVIETRIAVVGNVDAGKSSMLGVLVKGDLDDGRGKARVNLFRHKHEIETGRTSSVGMEIMGFDAHGQVITSDTPGRKLSWEEIGRRSAKVITFTDLAGHERYLRTTVFGLLSSSPNYCLLMVAANNGLIGMSKEHLGIALALNVPVMVVVTKIDICPPQILEQTIAQITRILKSPGARKIPIFVRDREQCVNTATQFVSQRICPVFQVSNVTGENLDLVRAFLNILPHHGRYDAGAPFEFHVNDTFSVPFVGTVVSGIVKSGVVHAGDPVLVGPDGLGNFAQTSIRSIERKRIGVPAASAGQSASFALKKVRRKDVRKGMVVLPKIEGQPAPRVYREFVAEVLILSHATTIKTKYQAMLHVGPVSQTCAIIDVDRPFIRTGDRATVAFRFVQRPEYLAPGDRLLFREGRTKGLGIVKSVGYDPSKPLSQGGGDGAVVAGLESEKAAEGTGNGTAKEGGRVPETGGGQDVQDEDEGIGLGEEEQAEKGKRTSGGRMG